MDSDVVVEAREMLACQVEAMPELPQLDFRVLSKSLKQDCLPYEEWRVEYRSEAPETMPDSAGQIVPAYLLVPRGPGVAPPFPAVLCFHQCNVDCLIGKDAVVGKTPGRRDQAYGYDLVNQGFVVLAPDTLNCGERNLPSVRQRDEIFKCHEKLDEYLKPFPYKSVLDARRAVDTLEDLDFVDEKRIGVMGHSGGAAHALLAMAADPRIKVGVGSCPFVPHLKYLPLISPRPFFAFTGELEKRPTERTRMLDTLLRNAALQYERDGVANNLVDRRLPYAHACPDEFKREAYAGLKRHLNIVPPRSGVDLGELAREALRRCGFNPDDEGTFTASGRPKHIKANSEQLTTALQALIWRLQVKREQESRFQVKLEWSERPRIVLSFPCADPEVHDRSDISEEVFLIDQWFFEHSAIVGRDHLPGQFRTVIDFTPIA